MPPQIILIEAVGAMASLWLNRANMPFSLASKQAPRSFASCTDAASAAFRICRNIFIFQLFANALSKGRPFNCKNEWKPISPRPTERSRSAAYVARFMPSGASSIKA